MIADIGSAVELVLFRASWVVLVYFVLVNTFYLVLMTLAAVELRAQRREVRDESSRLILSSDLTPHISLLVPAFNEASTIQQSVLALLTLNYPNLEIVVVDDGSTDATVERLISAFDLRPVHPITDDILPTAEIRSIQRSRRHPEPRRRRQGERRQGRCPQCCLEPRIRRTGVRGRRRHHHRARRARPAGSTLHTGQRGRRGRGHDPRRQ